jgi:magnesium transporter
VRRHVLWLLLLFAAEAYTGTILDRHGSDIGSETTLVRAIGLDEVQLRDVGLVLGKEVVVGLILGAICIWSATVAAGVLVARSGTGTGPRPPLADLRAALRFGARAPVPQAVPGAMPPQVRHSKQADR